jgi:peptidoglycan/LPS O-acetylase OafA/YrhL
LVVKSLLAGGSPKAVYRADIDGLRAISVLAVIAFHLNGSLPGGYTGVDVFFVISGFLIGGIVIGEVDEGRFSFITFYERRVRRILPALITTLIASSIAAYLLLGPSELLPFAKSAVAALLSAANIYFYATSGYFQANAIDVPLLHLWSLGVEEQFYLFFPLIVVAVARFRRSALLPLLIAAGIVSLIWSQRELSLHPQAAFYLLQGRAFELTIGIVLLFLSRPRMASWLAAGGVVLLVASMMALNENTAFPGFAALAPCVGTALIIWCADGTLIGRGLSVRPLVYLGKISYPLYLAHWPFIVFGKIAMPALDAGRFAFFVLAGSFVGAIAVYYLVERPIRYGSAVRLRWSMAGGLAMFLVTIVGLGSERSLASGSSFTFHAPDPTKLYLQGKCFLLPDQDAKAFASDCYPNHRPSAILWGDSHASDLHAGLKSELDATGYSLGMLASAACPPLLGYHVDSVPFCTANNEFVMSQIEALKPDIVIMSAFWKPHHKDGLNNTLQRLAKIPGVSVFLIGNTPIFDESVPVYLDRRSNAPIKVSDRSAAEKMLQDLPDSSRGGSVRFISLKDWTCPLDHCVLTDRNGFVYYVDQGHLSEEGSHWIARLIVPKVLLDRPRS